MVLVDDGSTDKTYEIARRYEGPKVKVIHQENKGKAAALNTGINAASGTIVLTVDADTRLNSKALTVIASRFSSDPRLGSLSGNVKVDKPRGLLQRLQDVEYATGIGLTRKGLSMLASVMIVPGPLAAFWMVVVQMAGGFAADTFGEDFDNTLAVL